MQRRWYTLGLTLVLAVVPVFGTSLFIAPTFDSSITSDPNAAAIEATINSAIQSYESLFSNPITVTIEFQEMGSGLGQSTTSLYGIPYNDGTTGGFYNAYTANASANNNPAAQAAIAAGVVANQTNNPVTGSSSLAMKPADIRALGIACGCPSGLPGGFDGIIGLNTSITSPGGSGPYSLLATVEHEIDEVLGLGSALGQSFQNSNPMVEDLFRYSSTASTRSYTTNSSAQAYLSINGSTDLVQFDNQNDGGDWGDWQSNPLPNGVNAQVQDAFATPGATPGLGPNEIAALEAVGYDLAVPESSTFLLVGSALLLIGLFRRCSPKRL